MFATCRWTVCGLRTNRSPISRSLPGLGQLPLRLLRGQAPDPAARGTAGQPTGGTKTRTVVLAVSVFPSASHTSSVTG